MEIPSEIVSRQISRQKPHNRNVNNLITKLLTFLDVPRAGIEPARLAALVFETNASTNSAIWACMQKP